MRVVAGVEHGIGDPPQLGELAIEADDVSGQVHDQNAVGGRFERGREQRQRLTQVPLGALPLADVAVVDDDRADGGVEEAVHRHDFEVSPAAILVEGAQLRPYHVARLLHELSEQLQCVRPVIRVDQLEGAAPYVLRGAIAEDGLGRLAGVEHVPVAAEEHDHVAGVLDQSAEPSFARRQCFGGPAVIGDVSSDEHDLIGAQG